MRGLGGAYNYGSSRPTDGEGIEDDPDMVVGSPDLH
jgi:hypothetical protein